MIEAHLNPDWYRVKYNLAALHANWSASLTTGGEDERAEAVAHRRTAHAQASELAEAALEQLVERPGEANPALLSLLEKSILPATLILYGGTGSRRKKSGGASGRFFLHGSPSNHRELLGYVRTGLNDGEALQYAASIQRPTPRVLYNLACAYAQEGSFEKARGCLQKALRAGPEAERKQLAQRAAADPTLRPLRDDGDFGFAETVSLRLRGQEIAERLIRTLFGYEWTVEEAEEADATAAEEEEEEEDGPTETG